MAVVRDCNPPAKAGDGLRYESGYMEYEMPKMKTNRAAAKRFRTTAKGRVKRGQSHFSHILTKKSSKRKRHLRADAFIADSDMASIKKLLPYS